MEGNCWDFMNCGRDKSNDCPAYPNYGRECWWVAGTKCRAVSQGTFAEKYENCSQCPWFRKIEMEAPKSIEGRKEKGVVLANSCWEFWNCGKDKTGDCPAYPNGGKECWQLAGTECTGEIQGVFAKVFSGRLKNCQDCPWYLNLTDRLFAAMKERGSEPS